MHHPAADGTVAVQDVEFPVREVGILWPTMRDGVSLREGRRGLGFVLRAG
jgi:hypothetical protein